jgi:hypothetical protein
VRAPAARPAAPEAPSPAALAALAARLRREAPRLRRVPLAERIAAVDRTAGRWLAADSPWRRRALVCVPAATGYPPAAVARALDRLWRALRAADLHAVARAELPSAASDAAPALAVHTLAGNVPGAGVFGVVAALLAGVPSLVKTARREPFLAALIAASLAAESDALGGALAVAHWPGGDAELDAAALAAADVVLAYGRAETLARVAAHRPRRLLRFGPRVSVGLVAREAVTATTAEQAALQVALFDQQGCLSPQLLLIEETDRATTERFTGALAGALARLDAALPRAPLSLAEAARAWRFLERARWREQEGVPVRVHAGPEGRFSVVCDRSGEPGASPLNRHLVVVPVGGLGDAAEPLGRLRGLVEALGYAGPARRGVEAARVAAACGASRLCPLERLQAPPFAWRQSGHPRLGCFFAPVRDVAASGTATVAVA